jgi:hypothetical protein
VSGNEVPAVGSQCRDSSDLAASNAVIAVTATESPEKFTTVVNDHFRVDYADVCLAAA